MKILVTGASGFIGQNLCKKLIRSGHQVIVLSRDLSNFQTSEAIIHLAGEPIANQRWTKNKKRKILESRVEGSKKLIDKIKNSQTKPSILISASAIGYYGNRGNEILTENSPVGSGFLAEVCQKWEEQTLNSSLSHTRKVAMRFGLVLGHGGALEKILLPFKLGLGGPLGNGKQWMSWIHMNDLIAMIEFILNNQSISGVVNAVSPQPITNAEFSKKLAKMYKTRSWLPTPGFALKIILGELSDLLLHSQRVMPKRITELGFQFQHPNLESAFLQR